jgi:hypothetical protein
VLKPLAVQWIASSSIVDTDDVPMLGATTIKKLSVVNKIVNVVAVHTSLVLDWQLEKASVVADYFNPNVLPSLLVIYIYIYIYGYSATWQCYFMVYAVTIRICKNGQC